MISLIIAGGVSLAANPKDTVWTDINNHTLGGETIASSKIVCRNMWGTVMLPNGKGGYSLIAKINNDFIAQSLIIPPENSRDMVAFRPLPPIDVTLEPATAPAPAPASTTPTTPTTPAATTPEAVVPPGVAPVEAPLPSTSAPATAPAAPAAPATQ